MASIIHDIRFCRMLYYKGKVQWIKRNMPLTVFIPCNLSVISTITKNTKISIQTNFFCKGSRAFLSNRIKDKILLTMSTWSQNFCVSHSKLYLWFSKEPIVKGFVCRFFYICQKGYISLIPLFRIMSLNESAWICHII